MFGLDLHDLDLVTRWAMAWDKTRKRECSVCMDSIDGLWQGKRGNCLAGQDYQDR